MDERYDVVVVGSGVAGLSAALSAVETLIEDGKEGVSLAVVERTGRDMRGGSSRWTGAYLRMADVDHVADGFEEDMLAFSGGRSDRRLIRRLADEAPSTLRWLSDRGVAFERLPTLFLTASRPRLLPVGGGKAVVERLAGAVEAYGVPILYDTTATRLVTEGGAIVGIEVSHEGACRTLGARAVVLASGGFEGNPDMLGRHLGPKGRRLRNISPGGLADRGEGIEMALALGAKPAGDFGSFHAEPVDPRSAMPEAVVMVFPYGILVNREGRRFVDEGRDTIDEIYEEVTRAILDQPGEEAWCISDQRLLTVPNYHRSLGTDHDPITAGTLSELAEHLGLPHRALEETVEAFNRACASQAGRPFTPMAPDGRGTQKLSPPKSNWAFPIDEPPFLAWPVAPSIVFTFGGIAVNEAGEVVDGNDHPIPGLFAAGEMTGLYYGKYPGATSFLRGAVFGRISGRNAIRYL